MISAVNQLYALENGVQTGRPVKTADLAALRRSLVRMDMPPLPPEYVDFLKHFNGVSCNQGFVFGICPCGDFFLDILRENLLCLSRQAEQLLLGYNEFDLLFWNARDQTYQLVDKADGQVIQLYSDFDTAISDILKTDNEQYLF